jgi:hypothetical protein
MDEAWWLVQERGPSHQSNSHGPDHKWRTEADCGAAAAKASVKYLRQLR